MRHKNKNPHKQEEVVSHLLRVIDLKLKQLGVLYNPPDVSPLGLTQHTKQPYVECKAMANASLYLWVPESLVKTRPAYIARLLARYCKYMQLIVHLSKPMDALDS